MKNDTYLMINGQKIELTDEQKKQLGIVEEKNCFDRVDYEENYYCISSGGEVSRSVDAHVKFDDSYYKVANYCTDKDLLHQRALHEILNRLLWRYSMTHDGDKIDWTNSISFKWYIALRDEVIVTDSNTVCKSDGVVYFYTKAIALKSIEEIVKPFIKEHPEFVW